MKRLILSISIFIFLFVMTGNVIANSANPYFTGSNSAGVVITGEDSVIEVLKEDLTLYIDGSENSSVSAKYTMKNTTDLNVRARMLFPFSDENDYKYIPDFTPNYSISKNGSILEYEKRLGYGNFECYTNDYLRYISNDYITYKCFSYDSTVYFYTYDDKELELNGEYDIIFYNLYGHTNKDNKITVKTDGYLTLDKGLTPDIVFKNFSSKVSCETTTMKDVVDEIYGRSVTYGLEGISDIDRYNYCINSMIYSKMMPCFYDTINFYDTTYYYEYTLEFQAYEVLENEVVAPLYTTIYRRTTPNTIYIKYLLSPASTFKDFSDLTVRINTNLYILNDKYGFKAVVGGYELHYDDLPHKEIDLKFASSPTVKEENNDSPLLIMIIIGLSLLICAPIIVFSIIYYKKTKGEKKDTLGLIEFISVLVLLPICASAIFGAFNYIEGVLYISILIMILLMVINIVNWAKNRKKLPNKLGLIILICVVYILGLCFSNWYLLALAALGVIGYIVLYFISRKE